MSRQPAGVPPHHESGPHESGHYSRRHRPSVIMSHTITGHHHTCAGQQAGKGSSGAGSAQVQPCLQRIFRSSQASPVP